MTWTVAVAVGIGQLIAAGFPGASRSGTTIIFSLLLGLTRPLATEYSFLVSIPTMLAAGGYKIFEAMHHPVAGAPHEELADGHSCKCHRGRRFVHRRQMASALRADAHVYPLRMVSSPARRSASRRCGDEMDLSSGGRRGSLRFSLHCRIMRPVNLTVTELTDRLIASYARVGGINHLDGKNLPSKTAIAGIACDLLRLLFPGFFDERSIHSSQLKVEITTLMDSVLERLEEEIYKSLEYCPPEKLE